MPIDEAPPKPATLFAAFFSVAISGFGGTLPFARRMLVEQRSWLSAAEFTETLSLCQSLPGPNIVNMSIVVGARACGWKGSLAAFLGLVGAPVLILIGLGALYSRFGSLPQARDALIGLGAAAAGLLVATAARTAEPLIRARPVVAVPFMLTAFAAVALFRLPVPYVLVALAPISIFVAWRWKRSV